MIARHWRALADPAQADAYVEHLRTDTLPLLATFPGFVSASILRRDVHDGTEFLVVTIWESLQAIRQFAGPDVEAAVVPEKVRRWMLEYDDRVRHYDILA